MLDIYKYISSDLCEAYNRTGKFRRTFPKEKFSSVEMDKNCWLTLPRWKSLCHSLARDQPQPGSFFQRSREAEKRDPGNEVVEVTGSKAREIVVEATGHAELLILLPMETR